MFNRSLSEQQKAYPLRKRIGLQVRMARFRRLRKRNPAKLQNLIYERFGCDPTAAIARYSTADGVIRLVG